KWTEDTLAAFAARVQGATATAVRPLARPETPRLASGESILAFTVEPDPPSSWYNGYTYLDTMSPEAVREFIKVTHEAYRKRFGDDFGRLIPGIFTDEPNYGRFIMSDNDRLRAPWTSRLPEVFRQRYGYNILDHLVEIFFDVDGRAVAPARYDYHDVITHLFVEAFAKQIGEWCQKNGIAFTGHVLAEETLSSQTRVCGSGMRFYEYMQVPGMDILTEHRREYDTAKQVSSVARQFGRKWRLTETYGCTGWDFPFAGHKAIGDWQVALGINLRCQHLAWYTMLAEAKRDYPAGIFYHSPWWQSYAHVEDYFARVHAAMTRGREVRDLLVIHPIESAWLLQEGRLRRGRGQRIRRDPGRPPRYPPQPQPRLRLR
ncbi:MAG TPA: glycosyl hydrolase, partial [Candidatus Brocadiia bacterium]|nr:glycosyl hydrolase [Candidatus Brocadiia bacterium]